MNQTNINEINHGTGAIPDTPDHRDFKWGNEIGDATVPFDWEKGFDIEQELKTVLGDTDFHLFVNDQNGSGSCGGQAVSKKAEVLSAFQHKKYVRKSAKYPYSQVHGQPSGSGAKPLFDIYDNQGMGTEEDTTSYDHGMPPAEPFMQRKEDITETARNNAKTDKSAAYAQVSVNIDAIAQAIRDSKGVILGIYGQNNGTWRTAFPLPPLPSANPTDLWAHWVYVGKAKIINGKKYIGFLNSWGEATGDKGWQWISEDYLGAKFGIFVIWTFVYDTSNSSPGDIFTRTIRFRDKGDDVKHMQELLKMTLCDGIYGKNTLFHVKQFQAQNGLVIDGIVGPKTQARLIELSK